MIEKSRLEELIKEGATVYTLLRLQDEIEEVNLAKARIFGITDNYTFVNYWCDSFGQYIKTTNERLFETKKQAEWALKYQRIPHTEYLDLPMWEDWQRVHKYGQYATSFYNKGDYYELMVFFNNIIVTKQNYGRITLFEELATEENYIKACDLCVKLFKGESDETNN